MSEKDPKQIKEKDLNKVQGGHFVPFFKPDKDVLDPDFDADRKIESPNQKDQSISTFETSNNRQNTK